MPFLQSTVQQLYVAAKSAGIVDTKLGQALFHSAYIFYKRHFEDPYARLAKVHPELFAAGSILDIGANIGYNAKLFASQLSRGHQVHAFEPEAQNIAAATKLMRLEIKTGRVKLNQCAIGDRDGHAMLWLNAKHHADHRIITDAWSKQAPSGDSIKVEVRSPDSYWRTELNRGPVSFAKIDVQGFEVPVVNGMQEMLEQLPRLNLGIEFSSRESSALGYDIYELLDKLINKHKYRALFLTPQMWLQTATAETIATTLTQRSYLDLLFTKAIL